MAYQRSRESALDSRRALSIARAARMYDVSKNTMRKILGEAGVGLITKGKVHRVLRDDLIRVMEGDIAPPSAPMQQTTPYVLSNADRAALSRASRGRGRP